MAVGQDSGEVVFDFDQMIASLRAAVTAFPDKRRGKNKKYQMQDAVSGAMSVFFTQCPSFLSHQKLMQSRYGLSNAKTLFEIGNIPTPNHIRDLLDPVTPDSLDSVFKRCFEALKESSHLETFRVKLGKKKDDLLVALDGTEYHSSGELNCKNCSFRKRGGMTRYCHSMVTPTIVAPGVNKVISLPPEFITPQDGAIKQDCEQNASKRFIKKHGKKYSKERVTMLGDDLYSHEPMCRSFLKAGFNFLLVAKPESHKALYEWIKGITKKVTQDRFDGKKHLIYTYNYAEGVPLRDHKDALLVNFVEITVKDRATGEKLYHNAFVTSHPLTGNTDKETKESLATLVDCGRARWKIENENNNTLKTKGYHLEHNYGHGKKHLSSLLAAMNLLAFLFHTMLEFMNGTYNLLRKVIGARKRFFEHIRVILIYVPCQNFDHLMDFMIEGLENRHELEKLKFPV